MAYNVPRHAPQICVLQCLSSSPPLTRNDNGCHWLHPVSHKRNTLRRNLSYVERAPGTWRGARVVWEMERAKAWGKSLCNSFKSVPLPTPGDENQSRVSKGVARNRKEHVPEGPTITIGRGMCFLSSSITFCASSSRRRSDAVRASFGTDGSDAIPRTITKTNG